MSGIGGIGKTFQATQLYRHFCPRFSRRALVEISANTTDTELQVIQGRLLRELCGITAQPGSTAEGCALLQQHLPGDRLLLLVDGVSTVRQLFAVLPVRLVLPEARPAW